MGTVWDEFTGWLKKPFDPDMDALHWFLFFGLLIVIAGLWRILLVHVTEG